MTLSDPKLALKTKTKWTSGAIDYSTDRTSTEMSQRIIYLVSEVVDLVCLWMIAGMEPLVCFHNQEKTNMLYYSKELILRVLNHYFMACQPGDGSILYRLYKSFRCLVEIIHLCFTNAALQGRYTLDKSPVGNCRAIIIAFILLF